VPGAQAHLTVTLRAAAAGDDRAWNELVVRFTPLLQRVARGFRLAPHEVDDVVQTSWLALLTSFETIRTPEALAGWLVTTARRNAMRTCQRDVREVLTQSAIPLEHPAAECIESDVIRAEQVAILRAAVRRLSGRQRVVLEALMAEPERSYVEVSEELDMPVGSIGPTRERGFRRLRQDRELVSAALA
jgi:RNA polymerase sigma factor (sigma-70 family)